MVEAFDYDVVVDCSKCFPGFDGSAVACLHPPEVVCKRQHCAGVFLCETRQPHVNVFSLCTLPAQIRPSMPQHFESKHFQ